MHDTELGPSGGQWGRKSVERLISESTGAYREGTNQEIQTLLEEWEAEVKQESEADTELKDWRVLVPDLGNTRGRITQFKRTLYLY